MKKRLLSILLAVLLLAQCISVIPAPVFAAEEYTGTGTFTQCTGALTSGYYVFGGGSATSVSAITNTVGTSWIKFTTTSATSGTITNPDSSIVWYYDATAGTFKNGNNYINWPTTGNTGGVGTEGTPVTVTETATAGVYNITVTATPTRMLRLNGTSGYRFYSSSTGKAEFYFFKLEDSGESDCDHTNKVAIGEAKDPTCTEDGITAGEKCADCGATLEAQKNIPATGHSYTDGKCSACGEPVPLSYTFDYTTGTNGTAAENVTEGLVTLTFSKGTNTSNSPKWYSSGTAIRFYENNTLTVSTVEGYYIKSVTLTLTQGTFVADSGTVTNGVWTPANKTTTAVVFTNNDTTQARVSGIIVELAAICTHTNTASIGEAKDATCTEDGITAGLKCTDCGEILEEQKTITTPGHNYESGACTVCGEAQCTEHKWVDGDVIEPATCSATGLQAQVCENCAQPGEDKVLDKLPHTPETDEAVAPTCTETGLTEGSHCSVCNEVLVEQTVLPTVDHNYVDGTCSVCGDVYVSGDLLADFQFGENGDASHKDGSAVNIEEPFTAENYTLEFTAATNVYDGAFDAMGNSVLKLGTSSKASSFSFTVDVRVNAVVLYIAGYKANTAKITINEADYTITSKSDEGDYTKIVVDTSVDKTVTLTTLSGGYRAMINSIEFWGEEDKIAGHTVTMGDNIGINFYMNLTEETLADDTAYMLFTLPNGETETVYVKDIKNNANNLLLDGDKTYYKFTGNIAVKEMADTVKAQLFTAIGKSKEYTYSVKEYAMRIIDSAQGYSETEKALAKAMLNYGANAQLMFSHNTDNLANSALSPEDQLIADITIDENYKKDVTANIEGATYLGTTTIWAANTAIRHYFTITGETVTFKLYDANDSFIKDLPVQSNSIGSYVAIDGIVAKDMQTTYKLVISNGTEEQTISYSVYSYFYDILKSESYSDTQKAAIKAAYIYAEAATEYIAEKKNGR